jgi:hypothetical protein
MNPSAVGQKAHIADTLQRNALRFAIRRELGPLTRKLPDNGAVNITAVDPLQGTARRRGPRRWTQSSKSVWCAL